MRPLLSLFALAILLVFFFSSYGPDDSQTVISHHPADWVIEKGTGQKGIYIFQLKQWLPKSRVKEMLAQSSQVNRVAFYSLRRVEDFTASAPGTDLKHHIVNSYLVGYQPFRAKNPWIPWQTLARKKTYQLDKMTNKGRADIWQTSRQAYKYTRGDCEDHAIALTDWLISMGLDARVAIGTYKGTGHAWVVLLKGGKTFILEATQKSGLKQMTKLPLAKQTPGYFPRYQFNRMHFWKNTGSAATYNYSSSKWVKKSKYNLGYSL